FDQVGAEGLDRAGDAKAPVVHMPTGATGDLTKLGRGERAVDLAVEFAHAGKGHVLDIEIEAHADGIGRHQEINIAGLVEGDLRVARARREGAEYDGRSATLAPDELGNRVHLGGGEGDHGRAWR